MIPKKIKMSVMTSNGNGTFSFSGEKEDVPYPLTRWEADNRFSMNAKTGQGRYFWTSQMFGGPKAGDIVVFKKSATPIYAIMTSISQNWDSRWGELKFLFFTKDYWQLVKESFIEMYHNKEITQEEFYQEMFKVFGVDGGFEICSKEMLKFVNKF